MRLAIFGGTFDPIHNAHLAIAGMAADEFQLDRVVFVPAAHPPHKARARAPYPDRVRMAELACQDEPRFEVSRLEEGTLRSYSIHTIEKVRSRLSPADDLFFIIGADAFAEIQTWLRWEQVAAAVCFVVVSRPGHLYAIPPGVHLKRLDTAELAISSSEIRKALAEGRRPAEVPERVLEYISDNGLYGASVPV